jgi:predicted NUDIX family phosphoesterase
MKEERIMCFKKELLCEYLNQSKVFYEESLWHRVLGALQSVNRSTAEKNYNFKQVVVYVVIRARDLYLTYRRTPRTQEERLRYKYSIGIGGHVNIIDSSQLTLFDYEHKKSSLLQAVWREIKEEINIKSKILNEPQLICFINDDSTDVGKVHFGTVWLLEIKEPKVSMKGERGIGKIIFADIAHLRAQKSCFEKWSQLLIDYLTEKR